MGLCSKASHNQINLHNNSSNIQVLLVLFSHRNIPINFYWLNLSKNNNQVNLDFFNNLNNNKLLALITVKLNNTSSLRRKLNKVLLLSCNQLSSNKVLTLKLIFSRDSAQRHSNSLNSSNLLTFLDNFSPLKLLNNPTFKNKQSSQSLKALSFLTVLNNNNPRRQWKSNCLSLKDFSISTLWNKNSRKIYHKNKNNSKKTEWDQI